MNLINRGGHGCFAILFAILFASCSGHKSDSEHSDSDFMPSIQVENVDSLVVLDTDTTPEDPPKVTYDFSDTGEILDFIADKSDASLYSGGIIPVIAKNVPKYASKLLGELETYSKFIIVDKASMRVILYDKYGQVLKAYDMACAKNYGTKHKKADGRTPEGFFSIEGKYNSTDWLFTDDNGVTSPKKGQFGPRFLRIKTPVSMQIGIHGTGSPWSMGHRVSHGCIRITNENIMELFDLVEKGMPVIVLPGKRDRAVNRKEGYDIPYFPTDSKYAMTESEKREKVNENPEKEEDNKDDNYADKVKTDSIRPVVRDSIGVSPKINEDEKNNVKQPAAPYLEPDSI